MLITAQVVEGEASGVTATITPLDGGPPLQEQFAEGGNEFTLEVTDLYPGGYRLEVASVTRGPETPAAVQDVFAVAGV